jgi:hypothetical protein
MAVRCKALRLLTTTIAPVQPLSDIAIYVMIAVVGAFVDR